MTTFKELSLELDILYSQKTKTGAVAHTYNLSYSEGRDCRIASSAQPMQKVKKKELGVVTSDCHPRHAGGRPHLKNN
jgi:hypothetical protein